VGIASSQNDRNELARLTVEDQKRMIHVLLVVAVVVGAFLLTMGRIVGRVEVQKDLARSIARASPLHVELE
jgi:hypothetical protein